MTGQEVWGAGWEVVKGKKYRRRRNIEKHEEKNMKQRKKIKKERSVDTERTEEMNEGTTRKTQMKDKKDIINLQLFGS